MRIRTIKPEIHKDEELWDLEQETGLPLFRGFTGLWGAADREGRFEWRPRMLKAEILPYWDGDFSRVLDALATRGFLVRYASQGREYGVIRTFTVHQVVNGREAASKIPPPPETAIESNESTRAPRVDDACPTRHDLARGEGKGREGNTLRVRAREDASPPDPQPAPPTARERLGSSDGEVRSDRAEVRQVFTVWAECWAEVHGGPPGLIESANWQRAFEVAKLCREFEAGEPKFNREKFLRLTMSAAARDEFVIRAANPFAVYAAQPDGAMRKASGRDQDAAGWR